MKKIVDFENHWRFRLNCLGKGITLVSIKQDTIRTPKNVDNIIKLKDN